MGEIEWEVKLEQFQSVKIMKILNEKTINKIKYDSTCPEDSQFIHNFIKNVSLYIIISCIFKS